MIVQSVYDFDARVSRKAEALVTAGYSVDVLALRPEGGAKAYTLNGVNVRTLWLGKKRGSPARYAFEYLAFFAWAAVQVHLQMWRRRYAVIDVNSLPDFLIFAPLFTRLMGARLVLDLHEITPEFSISKYRVDPNSWTMRMLKFQERASFNFADNVITITEPVEDLLVGRGLDRRKSIVMINSADEERFARDSKSATAERPAGAPDKFVMVYHGTLTRIYGLDIAIEALALARAELPGAELWILGGGPEKEPLEELAEQRGLSSQVKVVGLVRSAEIPGWLAKTDIGILPIRRDEMLEFAFPNKLPEYIIMGKAVIISRLKTIQHYFSEDAVVMSEPDDPTDLARQMIRLYRDPGLRERLVARAKVEYEPLRWDVMKRRYLELIELLAGPAPVSAEQQPAAEKASLVR